MPPWVSRVLAAALLSVALGACENAAVDGPRPTLTFTASPPISATPGATVSEPAAQMEADIRQRINDIRQENGLQRLEPREDLAAVARDYSQQMLREDFFAHQAPDGDMVSDRVGGAGISFSAVGENLFKSVGPVDHVQASVEGWMDSSGHRQNILREIFTQTGVGVAFEGDTFYVTQIFLRP